MIVISAINANTFEELREKVNLVEPYLPEGGQVHLDVADGTFTKNIIWHNPRDLISLHTSLYMEAHLMVDNIDEKIGDWLATDIKRIIFHASACADPDFVIDEILKAGKEAGISVSPDESVARAVEFRNKVKFYQILGVHPGLSGQKTLESTYSRIKEVRGVCQSCIIECDGGMNMETAKRAKDAGADIIVAASAIFEGGNVEENIRKLELI